MSNDAKEVKEITSKFQIRSADSKSSYAVKLKNAMTALPTHISVHKGIPVMRITSRGVLKPRVITLSTDKQAFFITHSKMSGGFNSQFASTLSVPFYTPSKGFRAFNDAERYVRHIDVADIDCWQVGAIGVQKLEKAKRPLEPEDVEKLLTIFHHGHKSMCFIVPDKQNLMHLIEAIKRMKIRYDLMSPWIDNDQLLLRYIYYDIDKDKSGTIDYNEFRGICKRINFKAPRHLDKIFGKNFENGKEISIDKALELLRSIAIGDTSMPADLVWDDIFGKDIVQVGPESLLRKFLLRCQKESASTLEDAEKFIESMHSLGNSESSKTLTKQDFVHFLHSKYNDAYDPAAIADLPSSTKYNLPLSYYWIDSSHNTYLMGDQLKSHSSVEAYQCALDRGSKCLELDCWDGHEDKKTGEPVPVIYHGHTLTPKMTFRDACLVTENYLIANPDTYPIILSLENHCTLPYQKVMARTMEEIFGKKLYIPTEKQYKGGDLPSPVELRGMVVIKGKRPPDPDEGLNENVAKLQSAYNAQLLADYKDGYDPDEDEPDSQLSPTNSVLSERSESLKKHVKDKPQKKKIQSELRKVTLLHGCSYSGFERSIKLKPTTMHSIGETKIPKLVEESEENPSLWREYNVHHMTRTYPAGSRVDSSNYNPVLAWAMGGQLVALNFQTHDSNLTLNDGLFRQGGRCGYVPKPVSVLGEGPKPEKTIVQITVLSARCLPKPKGAKKGEMIDPYCQIDLHDVRVNEAACEEHVKESFKTKTVGNNGFNPVWKKRSTATFEVHNKDVAFIHFRIIDDDLGSDDKIASSAIPFNCLRKGYRCVQLYDSNNTRTGPFESSTLFVKIE
jgi:hypothetical protein